MNDALFPMLHTERLTLTIADPSVAPRALAYHEENLAHLAPWSPPFPPDAATEEQQRARLVVAREEFLRGHSARFVAFLRDDLEGPIVGTCGVSQIVRGPFQAAYLGYAIGARFEGRGLMTEALSALVGFAFDSLRLHRIMANYVPSNERSGRVLRGLGFVEEGYAREYLFIDGAWRDHVLTALTNRALSRPA